MPVPIAAAVAQTARLNFAGQGIKLPVDWKDMGPHYPKAFTRPQLNAQPNAPTNLFHEATLNKYHTDAARITGQAMGRYIDGICVAITDAIGKWMRMASVVSVLINGPVGTLMPKGVIGPALKPFILARAPKHTAMETEYSNAIASALSNAWSNWQSGLSGVLTYPTFAAAPVPMAPPTPNVPVPLITFVSSGEGQLSPTLLSRAMMAALSGGGQHAAELFDAVTSAFYTHFQTFKTSTLVTRVMGTGPVTVPPTGPVTGGMVIPSPGNFV